MKKFMQELSSQRHLLRELVVKDLKMRYSRPALGILWALISPFLTVVILYLVFSVILQVKIKEAPFALYLMSAVFFWRFFQDSVMSSVTSLMDNKNLIKESKFAHYLIPLSLVLSNGIIFIFSLAILIAAVGFILKGLPVLIIFLPLVVILQLILTAGVSFIASLAYIKWRDTKYILDALLTVLFYLIPAFYSLDLVRGSFSPLFFKIYVSNPLVGMLNLYRTVLFRGFYAVTRQETGIRELVVLPLCFSLLFLCLGVYLYRKYKDNINDYLSY